ncbi:MAG: hypothetical protein R6W48_10225 [Gaiellaceae bacterium]
MALRALFVCLCALALLTGVASAQPREAQAPQRPEVEKAPQRTGATKTRTAASLEARLSSARDAARKHRGTLRFFENRRELLRSSKHRDTARAAVRRAERGLARAEREITSVRKALRAREARRLASLPPKAAICKVFARHCTQALDVAWCESRFDTNARNGQYLGLFQMGSSERRLFGHGSTAHEQARAAHRYFVLSGRDWSPWGCRWAAY